MKKFIVLFFILLAFSVSAQNIAVTNRDSNTVTIINSLTGEVLSTIPVGTTPIAVAFGNNHFFVCNFNSADVAIINAISAELVGFITVGTDPNQIIFENNRFIVVNRGSDSVSIIEPTGTTNQVETVSVGFRPVQVAFGNNLYAVVNQGSNTVTLINSLTNSVIDTIAVGENPRQIVFGDGKFAISNRNTDSVTIVDAFTKEVTTVLVGDSPGALVFDSESNCFVVANFESDNITIINASTNEVVDTIDVGENPRSLAFGNGRLAVLNLVSRDVNFIDFSTNKIIATVEVGANPNTIRFSGNRFVVANAGSNTVTMINSSTNEIISNVLVGDSPLRVAFADPDNISEEFTIQIGALGTTSFYPIKLTFPQAQSKVRVEVDWTNKENSRLRLRRVLTHQVLNTSSDKVFKKIDVIYENVSEGEMFLQIKHQNPAGNSDTAKNIVVTISEFTNLPTKIVLTPHIGDPDTSGAILVNKVTLSETPVSLITEYPTGATINEKVIAETNWELCITDSSLSLLPFPAFIEIILPQKIKENSKK